MKNKKLKKWSKVITPLLAISLATAITIPFVTSCASSNTSSSGVSDTGPLTSSQIKYYESYGYLPSQITTTQEQANFISGYDMWKNAGLEMLQLGKTYTFSDLMSILGTWSNIMNDSQYASVSYLTQSEINYMKLSSIYARAVVVWNSGLGGGGYVFPTISQLMSLPISFFVNQQIGAMFCLLSQILYNVESYNPLANSNSGATPDFLSNLDSNVAVTLSNFDLNNATNFTFANVSDGLYDLFVTTTGTGIGTIDNATITNTSGDTATIPLRIITIQSLLQYFAPYIPSDSSSSFATYLTDGYQWMNTWSNGNAFNSNAMSVVTNYGNPTLAFYNGNNPYYGVGQSNLSIPNEDSNTQYFNSSWGSGYENIWNPYDFQNASLAGSSSAGNGTQYATLQNSVSYNYLTQNNSIYGTSSNPFTTQIYDSASSIYATNQLVNYFLQQHLQDYNLAQAKSLNSAENYNTFLNQTITNGVRNSSEGNVNSSLIYPYVLLNTYLTSINSSSIGFNSSYLTSNLDSMLYSYIMQGGYNNAFSSNTSNGSIVSNNDGIMSFNVLNNYDIEGNSIDLSTTQQMIGLVSAFASSGLMNFNVMGLNLDSSEPTQYTNYQGGEVFWSNYNPTISNWDTFSSSEYNSYAEYVNQLYLTYYVSNISNGGLSGVVNIPNSLYYTYNGNQTTLNDEKQYAVNLATDLQTMLQTYYNSYSTSQNTSTPTLMQFRLMNGTAYDSSNYTLVKVIVNKTNALESIAPNSALAQNLGDTSSYEIPVVGYDNSSLIKDPLSNFYYITFQVSNSTTPVQNQNGNNVSSSSLTSNPFVSSSSNSSTYTTSYSTDTSTISSKIFLETIIDKNTNSLAITKLTQ